MIRLTGTGSGLDINSLVDGLVAASRTAPESRINTKQSDVSSEISALGRVKSALSALQTASETISEADAFNVAKITSSNSDSIEATDGGSDYRGSFNLEVLAKAQAHKLRSDSFSDATTDNGAGDITLSNAKGESFSITLASDASSLDEMAEAINTSSDNFGVQANVLKVDDGDYRLVLSATDTGTDAALTLDVSGFDSGIAFSEMAAAQDARVNVDGITVTRSSNTFDDIFPNIDININNAVVGDSTLIQAQGDSDAVEERLNTFVNAYNSFRDVIDSVSGSGAALNGDGLTRQLASQMRQLLAGTGAEANPSYQTAYSVGIEIDRSQPTAF